MCAIGTRYIPLKRHLSNMLYEYAFQELEDLPEYLQPYELQAGLLIVLSGIYSGNSSWFKKSVRLLSQIVGRSRGMSLFQYNPLDNCDKDWESFVSSESQRRISYGLYFIDAQLAILFNYPPAMSHYEIKHFLPCCDELWQAHSADSWQSLLAHFPLKDGLHFFQGLQQVLIYGSISKPISSFGGLVILFAIHIMIRNMAQYAGILETSQFHEYDTFSRRPQLGQALNGLRTFLPKKRQQRKRLCDMGDLFAVTWNLAYIHLHLPDTVITSGIVEVSLDETIATASALARPQSKTPPGTALLSNDFSHIPYQTLSFTSSHIFYFLRNFDRQEETFPAFTFMFFKASLIAWQVLNAYKSIKDETIANSSEIQQTTEQIERANNALQKEYMMKRLTDDILNCLQLELSDLLKIDEDSPTFFEEWVESVLQSKTTWGVGRCGAASFASMGPDTNI